VRRRWLGERLSRLLQVSLSIGFEGLSCLYLSVLTVCNVLYRFLIYLSFVFDLLSFCILALGLPFSSSRSRFLFILLSGYGFSHLFPLILPASVLLPAHLFFMSPSRRNPFLAFAERKLVSFAVSTEILSLARRKKETQDDLSRFKRSCRARARRQHPNATCEPRLSHPSLLQFPSPPTTNSSSTA